MRVPKSYKGIGIIVFEKSFLFSSFLQVLLDRALKKYPDIRSRLRALPQELRFADMFSGTGCYHKVVNVLFETICNIYPEETQELQVPLIAYSQHSFVWL